MNCYPSLAIPKKNNQGAVRAKISIPKTFPSQTSDYMGSVEVVFLCDTWEMSHTDLPLTSFHYNELLLRRCPSKHDLRVMNQDFIQVFVIHVFQICAIHHSCICITAKRLMRNSNHCFRQIYYQNVYLCQDIVYTGSPSTATATILLAVFCRHSIRSSQTASCNSRLSSYRGLTSSIAMLSRAAISSTVSFPAEMMPTLLAIAFAVIGWSPVTIIT